MSAQLDMARLRQALEAERRPDRVEPMAAYMKNQFPFLGVNSPTVRQVSKPILQAGRDATADQLVDFARACWDQPEREFQYVGSLLLRRWADKLEARHLDDVEYLITTKSWWDTVDSLAAWTVGPLVRAHPHLAETMDRWIDSDNLWLARTAILHQLGYKDQVDQERLFRYARRRAEDREFFIRKAIGWALRQYARQEPEAVRDFVAANDDRLSGLTKREALKHL